MNLDPYLISYTKVDLRRITDLNIKVKIIKHLTENRIASRLGSRQRFHKLVTENNNARRKKTNKLDFLRIKTFCLSKDTDEKK